MLESLTDYYCKAREIIEEDKDTPINKEELKALAIVSLSLYLDDYYKRRKSE